LDLFSGNRLLLHEKELEIFKKKDSPILTKEEIAENVEMIEDIMVLLEEDKREAEVNKSYVNCNLITFQLNINFRRYLHVREDIERMHPFHIFNLELTMLKMLHHYSSVK
jgi:hypothetical protein